MKYIAVKDFERFQHYKGRTPPWIKFYNALLDDYRFLQLSDAARSQLMLIWLVASRQQNRIPNDVQFISRAIHCTTKLQLPALLESGWLYQTDSEPLASDKQNASKPLATSPENATPEVEGEKERDVETENNSNTARLREALPDEYRPDFDAFMRGIGSFDRQRSWVASMEAHLNGMRAPVVTGETIGRCIRQFVGNGAQPNWRLFEKYLQTEANPNAEPRVTRSSGSRISPVGQTLAATELMRKLRRMGTPNPVQARVLMAPQNWRENFAAHEIRVLEALTVSRVMNDDNEGTLVSQLAKALEESTQTQVSAA